MCNVLGASKLELDADGLTVVLEQDGTEIDDDEVMLNPEVAGMTLMLLTRDEKWEPPVGLQSASPSGEPIMENTCTVATHNEPGNLIHLKTRTNYHACVEILCFDTSFTMGTCTCCLSN